MEKLENSSQPTTEEIYKKQEEQILLNLKEDSKQQAYCDLKKNAICYVNKQVSDESQRMKYLEPDGFLRLLYAREFNWQKSYEMFQKWVDWRLQFNIDYIDPNNFKHLLIKNTVLINGHDKENRVCLLIRPRYHTPGEQTLEEMIQFGIYIMEKATKQTEELGSKQLVVIYDRTEMTRQNQDSQVIKFSLQFSNIVQDYYAERLSLLIIINANWLYKIMYKLMKPFLTQRTKKKIVIIDNLDELKTYFESEQLLPEHGGTSKYQFDPYKEYGLK